MRIENWAIVSSPNSPHTAPEMQSLSLYGNVFGNPRFPDGYSTITSSIVGKTTENEVLTHSGSMYELGQVRPEYEEKFPNARNRLLDNLKID